MSVADWTCKSLKPILRRGGSAHQIIASVTPKIPIPKSHRLALGVAQTVEDFQGLQAEGAVCHGVNHGGQCFNRASTVLQPCFNRASTVLQPCFNRSTSLITPMDFTMELLPNPSTFRKNRKHVNQRFTILFTPVHCQSPTPLPHTL